MSPSSFAILTNSFGLHLEYEAEPFDLLITNRSEKEIIQYQHSSCPSLNVDAHIYEIIGWQRAAVFEAEVVIENV